MKLAHCLMAESTRSARRSRANQAGFTLIEIALCLAIIGFALVAIIGALPTGLNVQKVNREETIITQDASLWMDAIRNGTRGYDDLTNYVVEITRVEQDWTVGNDDTHSVNGSPRKYVFNRTTSLLDDAVMDPKFPLSNGVHIIGLLSTPQIIPKPNGIFTSNYTVAVVRALSGAAGEKVPQDNPEILRNAFQYRMIVEVTPYVPIEREGWSSLPNEEREAKVKEWQTMQRNSYNIRLGFRWPLLPTGKAGSGFQNFRLMTGGHLIDTNNPDNQQIFSIYLFEPPNYTADEDEPIYSVDSL